MARINHLDVCVAAADRLSRREKGVIGPPSSSSYPVSAIRCGTGRDVATGPGIPCLTSRAYQMTPQASRTAVRMGVIIRGGIFSR